MYDKADVNLIFEGEKIEEKQGVMQSKKQNFMNIAHRFQSQVWVQG